ncbi:hydrogenase maturation [Brachionus plicatilis]|uniref:Hydrogenase maturation n=1 Tax=Brachionus plicatilis TaxID=10195 RepID=A0A3M7Q3L4_BRAPC|nr:hydrogenase maturation [Brachionus plicatilis]
MSTKFNCKKVADEILAIASRKIKESNLRPRVSILLTLDNDSKPLFQSKIYVNKKIDLLKKVGIETEVHLIKSAFNKDQIVSLVQKLSLDPSISGIFVQLPLASAFNFKPQDITENIDVCKDVDALSTFSSGRIYTNDPNWLKPATPLGICALLTYYGIQTLGKNVAIIGKGELSGKPLAHMLACHPFHSSVTSVDIFTENVKELTSRADILISACGKPHYISPELIKKGSILIDIGISSKNEQKIYGDFHPSCYEKSAHYTSVPGGVGLLTTATLAHNVLNACLIQNGAKTSNIIEELHKKNNFHLFLQSNYTSNKNEKNWKVLLFSSSYNAMTQNIEKVLSRLGHKCLFEVAKTDDQMINAVQEFKPDLIVCPFLKKAIPKQFYEKIKCLIVHPGVKGDRGPSSLDWAILNNSKEWGVTVLEASREMDAGNIWATENFQMPKNYTKANLYNSFVCQTAEKLVVDCISKFGDANFVSEPLDYSKTDVKGNLHRTIRLSDSERSINWSLDSTSVILSKSNAADTQPGLKSELTIKDQKIARFVFGACKEDYLEPASSISIGEIFAKRGDAVCVKTKDGSVWFSCMRSFKSKENTSPIKLPSTLQLCQIERFQSIQESSLDILPLPDSNTYQEISFEKVDRIGILYFNFYNGAMDTLKCNRLLRAIKECSKQDINVLVLAGSETNWSNGIHLNVIENSPDPAEESWQNIKAINNVAKEIILLRDIMTISAIQANAGAGGVYLSLASDFVFAKSGVVFNPHYKKMGLFGSELHTLTAPKRIGKFMLEYLKESARPLITKEAVQINLIDDLDSKLGSFENVTNTSFMDKVKFFASSYSMNAGMMEKFIATKRELFLASKLEEKMKECEEYELKEMHWDMFHHRNSFDMKRKIFVHKLDSKNLN